MREKAVLLLPDFAANLLRVSERRNGNHEKVAAFVIWIEATLAAAFYTINLFHTASLENNSRIV